jgi:hypothetical protein
LAVPPHARTDRPKLPTLHFSPINQHQSAYNVYTDTLRSSALPAINTPVSLLIQSTEFNLP